MKKLVVATLILSLFHSFLIAEDVSAESFSIATNVIGIMEVTSKSPNTILAVPWVNFGKGGDIQINNLVINTNLVEGDIIYAPKNIHASGYQAWHLTGGAWKVLVEDDLFDDDAGKLPEDFLLARGNAFWLVRRNPTDESGEALPIYIIGQYSDEEIEKYEFSDAGYHLIASPNPAPFTPFALGCIEGASEGDKLYIQEPAKRIEYVYKDGLWQVYRVVEKKIGPIIGYVPQWVAESQSFELPLGHGFWYYKCAESGSVTINWKK